MGGTARTFPGEKEEKRGILKEPTWRLLRGIGGKVGLGLLLLEKRG